MNYKDEFESLDNIVKSIVHIHPCFEKIYPVAIVNNDHFNIYYGTEIKNYEFIKKVRTPCPMPNKIRAAFSIESFSSTACAVISEDAFYEIEEMVMVLHEFVHCYQYDVCEKELRNKLCIENDMKKTGNIMWEINYEFPYANDSCKELFFDYIQALKFESLPQIIHNRMRLLDKLSTYEKEYFMWQEWKEGFARYIENEVRKFLELDIITIDEREPFNRVSFYHSGSLLIGRIIEEKNEIVKSIRELYYVMNSI